MLGKVESAELHTYIIKFPTWTTVASILGWLSENITPSLEKKILFAIGVELTVEIARYIGQRMLGLS